MRILFLFSFIFLIQSEKSFAVSFRLKKELPAQCDLKRQLNPEQWVKADLRELSDREFGLSKEFPGSGSVLFRLDEVWFNIQKSCLEEAPIESLEKPVERNPYRPESILAMFAYRQIDSFIDNFTLGSQYKLKEYWKGFIAGYEKKFIGHDHLTRHIGADLETGVSTLNYSSGIVFTLGVRGFGGIGFQVDENIFLTFEAGILIRAGAYPAGQTPVIGDFPLGFTEEFRLGSAEALRFNQSIYPRIGNSYSFGVGLVFDQ